MARLWEDGFDHYGAGVSSPTGSDGASIVNMLDGSYAQVGGGSPNGFGCIFVSSPVATGPTSLYIGTGTGLTTFEGLRKVLPASKDKLGVSLRVYFPSLPSESTAAAICHMLSNTPTVAQLSFIVNANGAIEIWRGRGTPGSGGAGAAALLATTDPILVAAAWNHVEMQAYIHDSTGWVRIAVNGVHRFEMTDLDTKYDSSNVASIGQHLVSYTAPNGPFYMDDYIIYDFTGDSGVDTDFCPPTDGSGIATSYIGELQVWPLFPNEDTAEADWLKSTGTDGYALIDERAPDDADYIYSTASGDLSEFGLEDLPPEISYIRGLGIHARMSKSNAGAAMVRLGMKSVVATSDASERPLTVEPTYWNDQINVDPASSARWTRESLNAAWLRLTRSA